MDTLIFKSLLMVVISNKTEYKNNDMFVYGRDKIELT